jgi:hypothetical protein
VCADALVSATWAIPWCAKISPGPRARSAVRESNDIYVAWIEVDASID